MPTFQMGDLITFGEEALRAAGTPQEIARRVSESLVTSNLLGLDSHGIIRIAQYLQDIGRGQLDPRATPVVARDAGPIVTVDGRHAFGQVAASCAVGVAIEKVRVHGVGIVGLRRSNHIGRLGEYVLTAAEKGFVGLATCNGGGPNVAAWGAAQRVFGTNPIACAVPAREGWPILVDLATGAAAEGKVRVARNRGQPVGPGVLTDSHGEPTTDPNDFYNGGAILPIGGHKGSALSLMVEVLSGILTGAGCPAFSDYDGGNGVLFIVLDPSSFGDRDSFLAAVERMRRKVKDAKPGRGFDEVLLPGEPEFRTQTQRRHTGIPVDEETWRELTSVASRLGVKPPIPAAR